MKIACIGNSNNNFFSIVRYLRDKGFDAYLLLLNEQDHFMPYADSYSLEYQKYTRSLNWNIKDLFKNGIEKKIIKEMEQYDFIIGCDIVPSFLYRSNIRLDLFIPIGADLYDKPFFKYGKFGFPGKNRYLRYKQAKYQRNGIYYCSNILMQSTVPEIEEILKKLKLTNKIIRELCPMLYLPQYSINEIEKNYYRVYWYEEFKKIREESELIVFNHCRQKWRHMPFGWGTKGNDILIRGFADFVKLNIVKNPTLILIEYGPDVSNSKSLISKLGIEKNTRWLPKMYRKEIMIGLSLVDIGTGQFTESSLVNGSIMEVLAMGKPLLGYRDDEMYKDLYPNLYTMLNANKPEDVCNLLNNYVKDPEQFKQIGLSGKRWLEVYGVNKPIKAISELINNSI